ncbi:MAG: hypothetical protein IPK07_05090 [Deltaproteobacteria bacterium]|jgi:DNA-binding NtrC family response regulator|nr:hypothetical protein [Deltaproteobacteria bacterium]
MPTTAIAKQADTVRADLVRLEADLKTLLNSVGGAIGAAISERVSGPLSTITSHVDPLLSLLGAAAGEVSEPFRRGPGRPKRDVSEAAPKKSGRRRGGRGKKANLTAEAIQNALKETNGNKSAAARLLKVSQPTFYKYLVAAEGSAPASPPKAAKKPAAAPKKAASPAKTKK